MFRYWLLYFCLVYANSFFLNFKFGTPIKKVDKSFNISGNVSYKQRQLLKNINGFYGMIGPDVNIKEVKTLFELFTGDGNIQGVFFNGGELHFHKHFIKTDKFVYESKNGKIPNDIFHHFLFMMLHQMKMLPNKLGLANTALLDVNKDLYALYERDVPYLLKVDFENNKITTEKKMKIPSHSISGHTKYNSKKDVIETLDYSVMHQQVNCLTMDKNFNIENEKSIRTQYMPIIHDFVTVNDKVIYADSPLIFDLKRLLYSSIPVYFKHYEKTYLHVYDKTTNVVDKYECQDSFFAFHYSYASETKDKIRVYGCIYDDIDYSSLDIKGNYRCLVLDKHSKKINVIKNERTEKYNLDFPVFCGDKVLLRSLENKRINGFVLCDGITIIKSFIHDNRNICGEPCVVDINNIPHIISFAYTDNESESYLLIINSKTGETEEIMIPITVNIGFHSKFINK